MFDPVRNFLNGLATFGLRLQLGIKVGLVIRGKHLFQKVSF